MKWVRGFERWAALSAILAGACAGQSNEQAASPQSATGSETASASRALADARRARAEAEALAPPKVPPNLDRKRALEFLSGTLSSWLKARTMRSESAAVAYAAVTEQGGAEELSALLELGALWQTFGDLVQSAMAASVPAEFVGETRRSYLSGIFDATRRPFDEAYGALQRCVTRAEQTRRESSAAACKERIARLPELVRTPAQSGGAAEFDDRSSAKRTEPERPKLSGSQPAPCVFAGSLELNQLELWNDPQTKVPVARVWRVDLASLILPKQEAGPVRVTATWPIQGNYWLTAAALPLVLRSREELVKDHVWLDAGTPLQAFDANGGTVQAMRPRAWSSGSEPTFARRVSCAELALSGAIERSYPPPKQQVSFSGSLELSAAPGKPPIAKLKLTSPTSFELLTQRGPWRRVAVAAIDQNLPFSCDAWTKNATSEAAGMGMIGLLNPLSPSHVSTRAIKLFVAPNAAAPSLMLAPEVWFRAGKPQSGFVPIQLSLVRGPEHTELWAQQAELSQHARSLGP